MKAENLALATVFAVMAVTAGILLWRVSREAADTLMPPQPMRVEVDNLARAIVSAQLRLDALRGDVVKAPCDCHKSAS